MKMKMKRIINNDLEKMVVHDILNLACIEKEHY